MKENHSGEGKANPLGNIVHKHRESLLATAFYALAVILMTWPIATKLNSQLIGGHVDQWTHLWTFNWIKESFFGNPFYTEMIFYPVGVSLATHNIAWLNIVMWLPLQALFGEIAAYNLVFLTILTLNGLAIFLLANDLTSSRPAAFIAGLIFAIWPYVLSHHDHPNMIFVAWLPLALLFLKRALTNRTRRDVWLAILFIALISWARLHLFIMGSVLLGLYALYLLVTNYDRDNLKRLAFILLVAGLLSLPAAVPVAVSQLTDANPDDIFLDEQETRQTDVLAYFVPSYYHPLWQKGPFADEIHLYEEPERIIPRTPFLGYTLIFLVLSAFWARRRQTWFWGITAVIYILIALGPILRINGQFFPDVPMPYRLIEDIYFVRILRQPQRFNIILGIPLVLLAAQGAQYWFQRWRDLPKRVAVTAVFVGVILFEYAAFPFPMTNYSTPAWFSQLADEPEEFAILNIPVGLFNDDKRHMFDQVTHGKPIVNGKVARVPDEALAFFNSTPFLRSVFDNTVDFNQAAVTQRLRPLAQANVRYLVLHKDLLTAGELADWQQWLGISATHEDEFLAVYPTNPQPGKDFGLSHTLTADLSLVQATTPTTKAPSLGLVQADLLWFSTDKPATDYEVCFSLQNDAESDSQTYCTSIAEGWPTTAWEANDMVHGRYSFQADPTLPSGSYAVRLEIREVAGETAESQPIPLGTVQIDQLDWPIQWNDLIALTGFEAELTPDNLELTFYWQALQEMETSYKIFLHVHDPNRNELIAQLDTYPVDWTYLTNQWQAGEIVEDRIMLPLQELPRGSFQLFIGFYDEASGERLSTNFPENRVPLTQFSR